MGNRHLERAERIFPSPTPESGAKPLVDLEFFGFDKEGNRLYKPIPSLANPIMKSFLANIEDKIVRSLQQSNTQDTYTVPLLPDFIKITTSSDYPSQLDTATHARNIIRNNKEYILQWLTRQTPDTNLINVELGRRWGISPIENVAELLEENGMNTHVISTGGRKRFQKYGIVLEYPLGFYR